MAKRLSQKAKLALLETWRTGPLPANADEDLRLFLADANHFVSAGAADIIRKYQRRELIPHLVAAFDRLIALPYKSDVGCTAKLAVVKALDALNYNDPDDVFYRGIRFVQMEPAFGESIDTAAELRGRCGAALARIGCPDIFFLLTTLVMDPEPQARAEAVNALIYLNTHESELLLRMKVLAGEPHTDILSQCFSGLVQINPDHSIDFLAQFLETADPITAEDAAIALGETRTQRAFEILRTHRRTVFQQQKKQSLLLPIALTKQDEAFDYLLEVIEDEPEENAAYAVEALRVLGLDDTRRKKLHEAVDSRNQRLITSAYKKYFALSV